MATFTDAQRRRRVAWHEAGHAVIAVLRGAVVVKATVDPEAIQCQGFVEYGRICDFNKVEVFLGGVAAESIRYRQPAWLFRVLGGENDYAQALAVVAGLGWGESELESRFLPQAKWTLKWHWPAVKAVAHRLVCDGTLNGEEVHAIVEESLRPVPPAQRRKVQSLGQREGSEQAATRRTGDRPRLTSGLIRTG